MSLADRNGAQETEPARPIMFDMIASSPRNPPNIGCVLSSRSRFNSLLHRTPSSRSGLAGLEYLMLPIAVIDLLSDP